MQLVDDSTLRRNGKSCCQFVVSNALVVLPSNLDGLSNAPELIRRILNPEKIAALTEACFPELRDIRCASTPEARAFHVQRLRERLAKQTGLDDPSVLFPEQLNGPPFPCETAPLSPEKCTE